MSFYLANIFFYNLAPFDNLKISFSQKEILVLSAINGKGKTTILSHIADAFYEMAKMQYWLSFKDKANDFYIVTSNLRSMSNSKPSFVYMRFFYEDKPIDFLNIRGQCDENLYSTILALDDKIPFNTFNNTLKENGYAKIFSSNFTKKICNEIFSHNIITYFPSYRYNQPYFINDVYKINIDFSITDKFTNYLINPIECITNINEIAKWIMDIVLDIRLNKENDSSILLKNINKILSNTLNSKYPTELRVAIGPRNLGGARIQIYNERLNTQLIPSIFLLSSGEKSLFCLFTELLRQADNINIKNSNQISGIVLVDEIDKHLHIKLQKEILPNLMLLFPNIQFILSSHSPFINLGLYEECSDRSKFLNLNDGVVYTAPTNNDLFNEVYEIIISENNRFKFKYEEIKNKIDSSKSLQIISEGYNLKHIEKAISILKPDLIDKINFINGAENCTGDTQLKSAFLIMSNTCLTNKFLFIWDFDSYSKVKNIQEKNNIYLFIFTKNENNPTIKKGIENLYSEDLFTDDLYDIEEHENDYGKKYQIPKFNKNRFIEKIVSLDSPGIFINFNSIIEKIENILSLE